MSVRLLCIWLGHLWTLAAGGDKAIEYSACRFSAFMHMHISSSDCIIAYVIHQHSILPAAIYLSTQGALSYFASTLRLDSFGPTTQLSGLLSTPVTTFTNRLLVTERPPPAGADSGDHQRFRLDSKTKRVKETAQQQNTVSSTTCRRHAVQHTVFNSSTTVTAHPRQLVVIAQERQNHNLPSTLVAERDSAPLLLRNVVTMLVVGLNGGLWNEHPKEP